LSAEEEPEIPPGVVTVTSAVPAAPGGTVNDTSVALLNLVATGVPFSLIAVLPDPT
jgi:hypothetical protein